MDESSIVDKKSIRFLKANATDWAELAKDCVCFANAQGGRILIGIEDGAEMPAEEQVIDHSWPEKFQKNISQRTINVAVTVHIMTAGNGGEYIEVLILRNGQSIASTTDGRYYIRVSDDCKPVLPDEMARLAADKNAFIWETQTNRKVPKTRLDKDKLNLLVKDIRASDRVSDFVKSKSEEELLQHYFMLSGEYLTNLGILWVGQRQDRASLLYPPAIQFIRYNERDEKVWKKVLDDYSLNPKELLESVINDIPDWQESIEISDGLFRKNLPFFPIEVIRELVVNALVHRTYTTRGDIFINLYTNYLEIHSPGRLPYGVTPQNILSQSVRRNEHLSRVFYDLNLMEKEGSGYDLMYELLLQVGKPIPDVREGDDRVTVIVQKQFAHKEVVNLMDKASKEYALTQKEIIALGLVAQNGSLKAIELSKLLNQKDEVGLRHWLGRLIDFKVVESKGKTKGMTYYVNPKYLKRLNFKGQTNLKTIEVHRLKELIYQDLSMYAESSIGDIHLRIGKEIPKQSIKHELNKMLKSGEIKKTGERRWRRYSINK
ncbi:MAG: putative DNA binding domain-containing protein [Flavobacteriales bacterium]|nr:putative DNA binding domain-containing protein [Flavobacteriales bacterium]MCB9449715.1 putative DNA binding domain-containing protein [Flavobacteriales bacterium]